jgi:hypothetical protein
MGIGYDEIHAARRTDEIILKIISTGEGKQKSYSGE